MKNLIIFILFTKILFALEMNEDFRLDGYANLETVLKSTNSEDRFIFSTGVQGRYQLKEDISVTGHIYFEEEKASNSLRDYEEDIKWLYLDYYLGNEFTFRAGKFQFPIFTASEIGTIGYSRTWTENPISSYGAFGYDNFLGAELLKAFSFQEYDFLLQLSYGKSKNDLPNLGNTTTEGESNGIKGITLKSSNDWLSLNLGFMEADSLVSNTNRFNITTSENVSFSMFAIENQIDIENFSFKAGYIDTKLTSLFPDEQRYYGSFEYNYEDFTPYIYYSKERLFFKDSQTAVSDDTEKYSIGLRYDYTQNISFKLSYLKQFDTKKYSDDTMEKSANETFKGTINVLF